MRQDSKVEDGEVEAYMKTEIIRQSVADVKARAAAEDERRRSPIKTYSKVKSKIAGNMKSQKKAKKMSSLIADQQHVHEQVIAGNYDVIGGRTASPSKRSPTKGVRLEDVSPERTAQIARKKEELDNLRSELEQRRVNGTTLY